MQIGGNGAELEHCYFDNLSRTSVHLATSSLNCRTVAKYSLLADFWLALTGTQRSFISVLCTLRPMDGSIAQYHCSGHLTTRLLYSVKVELT